MRIVFLALALAICPLAARGEVVSVGAGGFVSRHEVKLSATPEKAFARLLRVQDWWEGSHTYSGAAKNLRLDARPGGCWCERLNGGFVEHMRVTYLDRPKALRLSGGLGPLASMGAQGAMEIALTPDGNGVKAVLTYSVSGYSASGWEKMAPLVDRVLAGQWARYQGAP